MSGQFGFGSAGSSPPRTTRHPALLVHGHGSLSLLRAPSPRGQCWIDEHISEDRPAWAGAIGVEHRVILDIVRGAVADGLRVPVMAAATVRSRLQLATWTVVR